nr:3800_t:CDS:2 [Entrophospora candida]CAG8592101.1 7375_t:CDS:2 [Entrophospora candida]
MTKDNYTEGFKNNSVNESVCFEVLTDEEVAFEYSVFICSQDLITLENAWDEYID